MEYHEPCLDNPVKSLVSLAWKIASNVLDIGQWISPQVRPSHQSQFRALLLFFRGRVVLVGRVGGETNPSGSAPANARYRPNADTGTFYLRACYTKHISVSLHVRESEMKARRSDG